MPCAVCSYCGRYRGKRAPSRSGRRGSSVRGARQSPDCLRPRVLRRPAVPLRSARLRPRYRPPSTGCGLMRRFVRAPRYRSGRCGGHVRSSAVHGRLAPSEAHRFLVARSAACPAAPARVLLRVAPSARLAFSPPDARWPQKLKYGGGAAAAVGSGQWSRGQEVIFR